MKADLVYRGLDLEDEGERHKVAAFMAETLAVPVEEAERLLARPGAFLGKALDLAEAGKRAEQLRGRGLRVDVVKAEEPKPPDPPEPKDDSPLHVIEGKLKLPDDAPPGVPKEEKRIPCPHCGEPILEVARRCMHCGQTLQPPPPGHEEDAPAYVSDADMDKAKQLVAQLGDMVHAPLKPEDIEEEALEAPPAEGEEPAPPAAKPPAMPPPKDEGPKPPPPDTKPPEEAKGKPPEDKKPPPPEEKKPPPPPEEKPPPPPPPPPPPETKACPFCAEQILAAAKKCKHCGEWIVAPDKPPPPEAKDKPPDEKKPPG